MISIVTAIITVLGTFLIKKLTKSSSELDEKRFEIYKHLDFDFKRKYNEKEYLYYADCYSFLCDKVVNDIELIYLYDKISLVYLKRINYFYRSLVKNGSTNFKLVNRLFIKLIKICINRFHHNIEKCLKIIASIYLRCLFQLIWYRLKETGKQKQKDNMRSSCL